MVDAHGMLVPLANTDPVVDALRDGDVLTVATDLGTFSFKLTGAGPAIADLAGCVTEHLEAEKLLGGKTKTTAAPQTTERASSLRRTRRSPSSPNCSLRGDHQLPAGRPGREPDAQFRRGLDL